jgi:threonine aldolase
MDLETVRELVTPALAPNRLATALLCMETTHNDASGAVLPLDHMSAIHALGRENDVPVHTDGARLFNAAVRLGVPAARIAAHTDSITFCISKGLSAPVGSVITGSRDFITRARAYRRMIGGNLRQGGVIAAAGVVALETMVDRLAEDHRTARRLAEGLHRLDASLADAARTETNIVQVETRASGRTAADWVADLKTKGVLAGAWSKWVLRLVTHRHIGDGDVERTLAVFAELRRR